MEDEKYTPEGADKFRLGTEDYTTLAEESIAKSAEDREGLGYTEQVKEGVFFELVQKAFGFNDCTEEETLASRQELTNCGYDLNAINDDRGPEGLSVGQIMDQLERQKGR